MVFNIGDDVCNGAVELRLEVGGEVLVNRWIDGRFAVFDGDVVELHAEFDAELAPFRRDEVGQADRVEVARFVVERRLRVEKLVG